MEEFSNDKSKFFEVSYYGLKLKWELFTIECIWDKLKTLEQNQIIYSIKCLEIPNVKPFSPFKEIYTDAAGKEKYHFFAYIKFFVYEGQKYGLVGGKTSYLYPDIDFERKKGKEVTTRDKRIARTFLRDKNFSWCDEIIIVNHEPFLGEREKDNQQAIFLEKFLQRQFNLFDSWLFCVYLNSYLSGSDSGCFTAHSIILIKGEIYRHLSTWRVKEMKKL